MRLLVTGAAGFVGLHLVARSLLSGRETTAFLRPEDGPEALPGRLRDLLAFLAPEADSRGLVENLRVAPGSFADRAGLGSLLAKHRAVLHAAGQVAGGSAERHRQGNVELLRQLVENPALTPEHLLVTISSVAAQGPGTSPEAIPESAPPRPRGSYGQSKRAAEELLLGGAFPGRFVITRPCSIFGPGDANFAKVFELASKGTYLTLGRRERWLQYVSAGDLGRVVLALLERLEVGDPLPAILQVAPPLEDPEEFHRALEAVHQRPLERLHLPAPLSWGIGLWGELRERLLGRPEILCWERVRDLFHPYWVHSSALLEETLPDFRWTPLAEACRETDRWYRLHGYS